MSMEMSTTTSDDFADLRAFCANFTDTSSAGYYACATSTNVAVITETVKEG
eukprot:CAMPEP_0195506768 /NCGR_PEP_ID=MMETSP0794_2-20130614/346_1 /TAXON_ID=515487 /ORGANISM="Stephanopyxis turris, Strain CCMP 815" /LENGTH=50 /DNA_ID=CAMNT_0040633203 /DNA_START=43 /DNA_END=192 /DNA_ORIENTATION=-